MDGITPTYNIGGSNDGFFGGNGLWLFAILALMWGGNGGFFGNNNLGYRPATAEDVNNGFNFNDLQNQNRDIMNAINSGTAQAVATTNQAKYDNINVLKDAQLSLANQIGEVRSVEQNILGAQQECCCNILRGIDGINYNASLNTAAIKEAIMLDGQKTRDLITTNKIETLQNRVNQLELQNAVAGVVKYPTSTAYNAGANPFCNCGCGFNN